MDLPADLPTDVATLQARLMATEARLAERDDIIERKEDRIIQLEKLVADFKRALFGSRSEKSDPDQHQLALEDIEIAIAAVHAEDEAIDPPRSPTTKHKTNRGHCPNTCRVLKKWSRRKIRHAVAEQSDTLSARTSTNAWTSSPPNSEFL